MLFNSTNNTKNLKITENFKEKNQIISLDLFRLLQNSSSLKIFTSSLIIYNTVRFFRDTQIRGLILETIQTGQNRFKGNKPCISTDGRMISLTYLLRYLHNKFYTPNDYYRYSHQWRPFETFINEFLTGTLVGFLNSRISAAFEVFHELKSYKGFDGRFKTAYNYMKGIQGLALPSLLNYTFFRGILWGTYFGLINAFEVPENLFFTKFFFALISAEIASFITYPFLIAQVLAITDYQGYLLYKNVIRSRNTPFMKRIKIRFVSYGAFNSSKFAEAVTLLLLDYFFRI